jgi:hypothetical protein
MFLTPDKMPDIILDTDSEESENDNNGTVKDEEDYEQCGPHQSCCSKTQNLHRMAIQCSSVHITTEMPTAPVHLMSVKKMNRMNHIKTL